MRFRDYLQWPPPIQFHWLKKIDYWPPLPESLEKLDTLCLGVTSRTIGDASLLTTLPRKLKAKYPQLRITTCPRGFNPHVFKNNPYVDGVQYLPDRVYGDFASAGYGHNIQLKEQFFNLPVCDLPKPEYYLSELEKNWARPFHKSSPYDNKPVCILHPWAQTHRNVSIFDFWAALVKRHQKDLRFWQIGVNGERLIPECEQHFLFPRVYASVRKMMALVESADLFIGLDSGPMHLAAAFDLPSIILLDHCDPAEVFERRRKYPYFLHKNYLDAFIYPQHHHIKISFDVHHDLHLLEKTMGLLPKKKPRDLPSAL